ncbi:sister chromatid cohesion 1 protein 2 isoform X2 [Euphorbia lathyris]|uniref:sister chromatid cohesion 1 protein 2 isoform X2 n=1 Tax=Euphorbia lathyris TaxID=212925 RepID=UPI0033138330
MFYSHCLVSRNGPLGAIWMAAYFLNKLNKSQVTQIDISSSVDKILQDEVDVVTYRVLAYLLLGVVRVFSKKVEYLFNDCNKALLKIRDLMVSNKDSTQLETLCAPYFSITMPEKFELDAFDLEILEDAIGGHVLPHEDITLKESRLETEITFLQTSDKHRYEEFATCQDICSASHNLSEDVLASHQSRCNVEMGASHDLSNLEASKEMHQGDGSSLHEPVDHEMSSMVEEEPLNPVKLYTDKHHSKKEHTQVLEVVGLDGMHEEPSMQELWGKSICEEALLNLQIFSEVGQEDDNRAKLSCEHHQTNAEELEAANEAQLLVENHQIIEEDCNGINDKIIEEHCDVTNTEASMEKLRDNRVSHEEHKDMELFSMVEEPPEYGEIFDGEHQNNSEHGKLLMVEEPAENTRSFGEKHQTAVQHKSSLDGSPSGNMKFKIFSEDRSLSVTLDTTPTSKFPNASGVSTPEVLGIPTPVAKEGPRVPRKRKCHFDDVIVFPNNVIRRCIEDSTDLVSKRRKAPHTALDAWRAHHVSSLSHCFLEPLIPCSSSELRSLFCQQKLKIPASLDSENLKGKFVSEYPDANSSVENVESLQRLDESKACNDGRSVENTNSLDEPNVSISLTVNRLVEAVEPPEKVDVSGSPTAARSLEQTAIAPETPVQCTKSLRSFESPERPEVSDLDRVRLESEREEKDQSSDKQQDSDLSFINEGTKSSERDNQDQNGLCARTRLVMKYLNKYFLNQKKKKEEEVVSLMPLVEGRSKKRSAMLFYEILVLKSKGYVDVKQESAYEEILVWKSSCWEGACDKSWVG